MRPTGTHPAESLPIYFYKLPIESYTSENFLEILTDTLAALLKVEIQLGDPQC